MTKNTTLFDANFTAGGLLLTELNNLKPILLGDYVVEKLKEEEGMNAFIAIKTEGARKRILAEVKRRYECAPEGFWPLFFEFSAKEQALAAFYLCLKSYRLVLEMHLELGVPKFKTGGDLTRYDVTLFLDTLAGNNVEVSSWSSTTLDKLNGQYRMVLKDCGLMEGERVKAVYGVDEALWSFFKEKGEDWFLEACFIE